MIEQDLEPLLREAEQRLQAAPLAGDVDELDRLLDDRLVASLTPGTDVIAKAVDLASHRSGRLVIDSLVQDDLVVVVAGRTGVTRVLVTLAGSQDGVSFSGPVLYTRTWTHDDGRGWRVLAAHISPL